MRNLGLGDLGFLGAVGGVAYDSDAQAYITAVETADGQALETAVKDVIDAFVRGCKTDGIWTAIKASCILAGARTLNGALVPLVGEAPTNFNFVSGDYNRKTGLKGDGSTKGLSSNRNNNTDPQNSRHFSLYSTSLNTNTVVVGANSGIGQDGRTFLQYPTGLHAISSSASANSLIQISTGLAGITRIDSQNIVIRGNNVNTSLNVGSSTPVSWIYGLFGSAIFNGSHAAADYRLAFYSIGESLDLAKLDSRVTTLINAFGTAIP